MELDHRAGEEKQYLTFLMGAEQYSLDIHQVKEIIAYNDIMEIPMMPNFVKGVINLRGHAVPVIDLALRFRRKGATISKLTCIIILEVMREEKVTQLGIMVDSVNEVISLTENDIEESPDFGDDVRADFISGMGRIEDKFIIMLNVSSMLNLKELEYINQAAEKGREAIGSPSTV